METKRITDRELFTKPAEELAPWLLGKIICRQISENEILRFRITDTEAYPYDDTSCHANRYKTGNGVITQNMIGGTLYVHYDNTKNTIRPGSSFDIVSNEKGIGEGVLIKGGINIDNPDERYDGKPILLGEALRIDYKTLNQADLITSEQIWIEDDGFVPKSKVEPKKREGLDNSAYVAEVDKNRLLRFTLDPKEY